MSIVKRAVQESKDVARLAKDAAKNELIEHLSPAIQAIIDGQLRRGALQADVAALRGEGVNRMRQAADYDGISDFEEGRDVKKDKKDKMESVANLFPGVTEVADVTEADDVQEGDDGGYDDIGAKDESLETEGADDMDEDIELSQEQLEAMYNEAVMLEMEVSKGFKDMAKPHEFGAGAKAQYQSDPANLADYKNGEAEWDNVEPPAKKDFIPERFKRAVAQGLAENNALTRQVGKLTEMVRKMHTKLSEVNLLNAKILHVNKFMQAHRLTSEQKRTVIESLDRGTTVKEVKSIYSIIESTFKASGAVSETVRRAARADNQKRRTSGAPDTRVLRESADKADGGDVSRWQQLAGLNKLVNG